MRIGLKLLLLLLAAAVFGCSASQSEWHEVTSPSGDYVAEFPAETSTSTQTDPNTGMAVQVIGTDYGDLFFGLAEGPADCSIPTRLDEAIDQVVEHVRTLMLPPSSSTAAVTANQISRTTGEFEGVETRRVAYKFFVDGAATETMTTLLFCRDDTLVQLTVLSNDEADSESVNRFLTSLKTRSD